MHSSVPCYAAAAPEGPLQKEGSAPTALVREVSLGVAGVGMPRPRPKPGEALDFHGTSYMCTCAGARSCPDLHEACAWLSPWSACSQFAFAHCKADIDKAIMPAMS